MSPSDGPPDRERYAALTDGLDIEQIRLSQLENAFTIGAEYYGRAYVSAAEAVRRLDHATLGEMSEVITDGDHGSPDYQPSGTPYLLSESVQEGYIDMSRCRFITEEKNRELRRSELHPGDVVVTKTGVYFGKSAVVPAGVERANMIAHVGKITLKPGYDPYYVSTFLNCRYGYYQLRRRGIKATRPEIKLVEFPQIMIPLFSGRIEALVRQTVQRADSTLRAASALMGGCVRELERALGAVDLAGEENRSIRRFSQSFLLSGRLDAEYYRPEYDRYCAMLHTDQTVGSLCRLCDGNFIPEPEADHRYIELANVGPSGDISGVAVQKGGDLPSRARRRVKAGQVIVSSVEGSLQNCAIIPEELDGAICSTGFFVLDSGQMNAETLFLLFRSAPIQALMRQRCSGTILPAINKDDLLAMPLPLIERQLQARLAEKLQAGFALRRQAKELLSQARRAVETAVERGEAAAAALLEDMADGP